MVSNKKKSNALPRIVVCLAALWIVANEVSRAELLGDKDAILNDQILGPLVEPLEKEGIDIVGGNTAKVPLGARPRIALLYQMKTNTEVQLPDTENQAWITEFLAGTTGIIGAVQYSINNKSLDDQGFLNIWQQAPQDKRVFLSFTRLDIREAEKVKTILEAHGNVVFTFLNTINEAPKYPALLVGELFGQAGTYIVLDTNNARKSKGIWLEMRAIKVKEIQDSLKETNQGAAGMINAESNEGSTEAPSRPIESPSKLFTPELPSKPFTETPSKPFTTEAPRPFERGKPPTVISPNKGLEGWKLRLPL